MSREYHSINLLFPDVYLHGGPDAFEQFSRNQDKHAGEKNLVVIPGQFIDRLDVHMSKQGSAGALDTLRYLTNLMEDRDSRVPLDIDPNVSVFSASEGLDVAVLDENVFKGRDFSNSELAKLAYGFFSPDMQGKKTEEIEIPELQNLKIITTEYRHRIKYNRRGFNVERPEFLIVDQDIVQRGMVTGDSNSLLAALYEHNGKLPIAEATRLHFGEDNEFGQFFMNQFVRFPSQDHPVYAKVTGDLVRNKHGNRIIDVENQRLELLADREYHKTLHFHHHETEHILGISPRDMEQYIAMQYGLMNKDVQLMFLTGTQGSGKTVLAYACAVDQILSYDKEPRVKRGGESESKSSDYDQIVLLKPNEILGGKRRDPGALPGDLFQKLSQHLAPYADAHRVSSLRFPFKEMFLHPEYDNDYGPQRSRIDKNAINGEAHLPYRMEAVQMTYTGFMRGRSFERTLVIVDEAQSLSPYELKTIAERLGEGSKLVVMGDPRQTDNPNTSLDYNGLTYLIKQYLDKPYSMLVNLTGNYRSQVSEDALDLNVYAG
ncbi:PhoH family protein [Candidatus Woesearchaeota archaeon]|nr:PhoH family protein [Candidatus Woesearchaeota archaeon]